MLQEKETRSSLFRHAECENEINRTISSAVSVKFYVDPQTFGLKCPEIIFSRTFKNRLIKLLTYKLKSFRTFRTAVFKTI